MNWMWTGNDQLDHATHTVMLAALRNDTDAVMRGLPYVRAAIADLPVDDTCKRALMQKFNEMSEEISIVALVPA